MIDAVIEELKTHQTQLDQDGVMVGVSRQALEELLAHVAAPAHPSPIAGLEPGCPFCGRDPFHRIDNGIGLEAVAVTCCDLGDLFFRGARAAPSEVTLSWEEFMEIGHKIAVLRMSAAQLEAHAAEQVRAERREFTCAARKQSLPEPADCDWPVCGCDPYADKVIAALEESGALKDQSQHPAPIAGLEPVAGDPIEDLVQRFSEALLAKLRLAQSKGRSGWDQDDWEDACRTGLMRHINKGDPRDVAAYCAFMWHHGWSTAPPKSDPIAGAAERGGEVMPKKELVDIAAEMKRETDKAFQIFDGARTEWVPKSQVERNDNGTFTMPEWLAMEKGFI